MALETGILKLNLKDLFSEMRTKTEVSDEYFAERFSTIIEQYVKTGQVDTVVTTSAGNGTGIGSIT